MALTVVLGFDMETDIGSWTPFYEGLVHGTPLLLDLLAKKGVQGTFFFVGDAARQHPKIPRLVDRAGHEVGCHTLYHETVGEEMFPIPGLKPILPEECFHRIETATQWVQEVIGKKVTSFRAPRLWGSTTLVNALEALGYTSDSTYPMYYYKDRLVPYHPSRKDWTREGKMKILEIPNFADMTLASTDPYGRDRDQWPLFRTRGAKALMRHVRAFLGYVAPRHDHAVLCFYFHPWEFWPMPQKTIHFGEGGVVPSPFLVKNCGQYALDQLGRVIDELQAMGATFASAGQLAAAWPRKK